MMPLSDFLYTDDEDDVMAAHVNRLTASGLRGELGAAVSITTQTALTDGDFPYLKLTPNAALDVLMPPEASTNHLHVIENGSDTYTLTVKDDSDTNILCLVEPRTTVMLIPSLGSAWKVVRHRDMAYKLVPTVASNHLSLALTHADGTTPSTSRPLCVKIGSTWRTITASLSLTINAGANTFNAGAAELATKEVDYFAYVSWKAATNGVVLLAARIPQGRLYSDFSGTATNEKYAAYSSAPASTDEVANVGRFAATLSAGAGYTWTVPTYTNLNLIHEAIYSTRRLDWVPTHTRSGGAYTNAPTLGNAHYQLSNNQLTILERHTQNATPGSSGNQRLTLPFANGLAVEQIFASENLSTAVQQTILLAGSSNLASMYKYDGTAECTASQVYGVQGSIFI